MNWVRRLFNRPANNEEVLEEKHKRLVEKANKMIATLWKLWERTPTEHKNALREDINDFRDTLFVYGTLSRLGRITIEERIQGLTLLNRKMKMLKKQAERTKLSMIGAMIQTYRENIAHREQLRREQEALRDYMNGQPRVRIF